MELQGWVDWDNVAAHLTQLQHVIAEMRELGVLAPLKYDLQGLGQAVERRLPDSIKGESLAILTVLSQDVERLSKSGEPAKGFDLGLYEIFVRAYFLLWDIQLSASLGEPVERAEANELGFYLERLSNVFDSNMAGSFPGFPEMGRDFNTGVPFSEIRATIQLYLNSLIE
jgi:hypothetical protein